MSKVALILTGHLRYKPDENIGFSINVLNSLFPNSEVEIFLSTYDDLGYFQNYYKDYTNFKTPWISSENSSINLINELNDKYNFKYLNVENFKNCNIEIQSQAKTLIDSNRIISTNPGLLVSGLSIYRKRVEIFDNLRNLDSSYEYIFQTRPDVTTKFSKNVKLNAFNMFQISSIIYGKSDNSVKFKRLFRNNKSEIPFYGEISMLMNYKNYEKYSTLYNKKFTDWIVDIFNSGNTKFVSSKYDSFLNSWEMPEYILSYAFNKLGFEITTSINEIQRDKPKDVLKLEN